MRKRGSAIIIAFFLMAAISGVAFAIARLFYLDVTAAHIYENSTIAYYAAESGVEEGLLRYRNNRQYIVGDDSNSDFVNRNNLSTLAVVEDTLKSDLTTIKTTESIYDLRMSYKAKFYGNDIDGNGTIDKDDIKSFDYGQEYKILRDESVKIDITDTVGIIKDVNLITYLSNYYTSSTVPFDETNVFIEARVVGTKIGSTSLSEYKKILATNVSDDIFCNNIDCQKMSSAGTDVYSKEGLVNTISRTQKFRTDNDFQIFLYLRPVGCDVVIGLTPNSSNNYIAAPYSTVKSTGYYGGISRTLEAKIDRQSGTVYDIFDFVTYQYP